MVQSLSTIWLMFGMSIWQCAGAGHGRKCSQMCMKSRQPHVELSSKCSGLFGQSHLVLKYTFLQIQLLLMF